VGLTLRQAIGFAQAAGFRGEGVVTIVSISLCECGSQACGCNYDCCPPAQSCGVLQFYQPAHPGTAACANDPACAYRLAFQISGGWKFTPWSTFNNGCWLSKAPMVRAAMVANPAPPPPAPPPVSPPAGGGWRWALLGAGVALSAYALGGGRPGAS
jgi:Lysozyme like domain